MAPRCIAVCPQRPQQIGLIFQPTTCNKIFEFVNLVFRQGTFEIFFCFFFFFLNTCIDWTPKSLHVFFLYKSQRVIPLNNFKIWLRI